MYPKRLATYLLAAGMVFAALSAEETPESLLKKMAEKEAQMKPLREKYSKDTPEAAGLMSKLKDYSSKIAGLETEKGKAQGGLSTLLSNKYPEYKTAADAYDVLKRKYKAVAKKLQEPKKEKKKRGWGASLFSAAKSITKDATAEDVKQLKAEVKTKGDEVQKLETKYAAKTPESKGYLDKIQGYAGQITSLQSKKGTLTGQLNAVLSKKYPDYKKLADGYNLLKAAYDKLVAPAKTE